MNAENKEALRNYFETLKLNLDKEETLKLNLGKEQTLHLNKEALDAIPLSIWENSEERKKVYLKLIKAYKFIVENLAEGDRLLKDLSDLHGQLTRSPTDK